MTENPRNAMVCGMPYLQNEFGDPRCFFYVFNLILSFSICSQNFKKICTWELLGENVLKRNSFVTASTNNNVRHISGTGGLNKKQINMSV